MNFILRFYLYYFGFVGDLRGYDFWKLLYIIYYGGESIEKVILSWFILNVFFLLYKWFYENEYVLNCRFCELDGNNFL